MKIFAQPCKDVDTIGSEKFLKIFSCTYLAQFTRIKLHLSACDVVLVPSTADYGGGRGVGGRGSSGGNTPVEKSQEETRKFIESFYNSLTSPEDFPETEPSKNHRFTHFNMNLIHLLTLSNSHHRRSPSHQTLQASKASSLLYA